MDEAIEFKGVDDLPGLPDKIKDDLFFKRIIPIEKTDIQSKLVWAGYCISNNGLSIIDKDYMNVDNSSFVIKRHKINTSETRDEYSYNLFFELSDDEIRNGNSLLENNYLSYFSHYDSCNNKYFNISCSYKDGFNYSIQETHHFYNNKLIKSTIVPGYITYTIFMGLSTPILVTHCGNGKPLKVYNYLADDNHLLFAKFYIENIDYTKELHKKDNIQNLTFDDNFNIITNESYYWFKTKFL